MTIKLISLEQVDWGYLEGFLIGATAALGFKPDSRIKIILTDIIKQNKED